MNNDVYYGILLKHQGVRLHPITVPHIWSFAKGSQVCIQTTCEEFKRYIFKYDKTGDLAAVERNNNPPSIEDEISLQELIASSEEIYGYVSHLSPEMYSRIEPLIYNKVKEAFTLDQGGRIHEVFNIVLKELKDGIRKYE